MPFLDFLGNFKKGFSLPFFCLEIYGYVFLIGDICSNGGVPPFRKYLKTRLVNYRQEKVKDLYYLLKTMAIKE